MQLPSHPVGNGPIDGRLFLYTEGFCSLHPGPDGHRSQPVMPQARTLAAAWIEPVPGQSARPHAVDMFSWRITMPRHDGEDLTPQGRRAISTSHG